MKNLTQEEKDKIEIERIQSMSDEKLINATAGAIWLEGDPTEREKAYKELGKENIDWAYNHLMAEIKRRGISEDTVRKAISDSIKLQAKNNIKKIISSKQKPFKIIFGILLLVGGGFGVFKLYKTNKIGASISGIGALAGVLLLFSAFKK